MPAFNGTGPAGMGPMTGWGRGYCNPYRACGPAYGRAPAAGPVYWVPGYGRGFGRFFGAGRGPGFGRGRGCGRGRGWFGAYPAWGRW